MTRSSTAQCVDAAPEADAVQEEALAALAERPRRLPCKLFYDARGSRLFELICELDEYYLTRTELEILRENVAELAGIVGPRSAVVEFGSGASVKTRVLLDALEQPAAYVSIDISRDALLASAAALEAAYPKLSVRPVHADYTRELELPSVPSAARTLGFFPGSTIGNFEPRDAVTFLRRVRGHCGPQGLLLVGVDLKKDRATLEAAYDDRAGVTAEFNRNILRVMNREHGARFSPESFAHRAIWNERAGRIEMHLVSRVRQRVRIGGDFLELDAGEAIVTEHCYKYDLDGFQSLAKKSGFETQRVWTDPAGLFSVHLLAVA